jgi:hypothetical protein
MLYGHTVAVGLKAYHAEPVGTDRFGTAAGKMTGWQRKQMRAFLLPQLAYGLGLPAQASPGFRQTPLPQKVVELLKGLHLRHRNQEVTAGVTYEVFHQPLFMGLLWIAEAALKEIVAPESNEGLLLLGLMSR